VSKYDWSADVGQDEQNIATSRLAGEFRARIGGRSFSLPAIRDAALAELLATPNLASPGLVFPASDYGAVANGITDDLAALQAVLAAAAAAGGGIVLLAPGVYGISHTLSIPGNVTVHAPFGTTLRALATGSNDSERVVLLEASDARLVGITVDGNIAAREATAELTTFTHGIEIRNASHCRVQHVRVIGVGRVTGGAFEEGTAYLINRTSAATADVTNNVLEDIRSEDTSNRVAFHIRLRTDFTNFAEGEQGFGLYHNTVERGYVSGGFKNCVELAGPDTKCNTIRRVTCRTPGGQGGIEADFGASHNLFDDCCVIGGTIAKSFDGFSARTTDLGDGKLKISTGNVFRDCTVAGMAASGIFFLRGFSDESAKRTKWVRPRMFDVVPADGTTDRVIGYWGAATYDSVEDILIEDMDFRDVQEGIRLITGPFRRLTFRGGGITSSRRCYRHPNSADTRSVRFIGIDFNSAGGFAAAEMTTEQLWEFRDCTFRGTNGSTTVLPLPTAPNTPGFVVGCMFDVEDGSQVVITRSQPNQVISRNIFVTRSVGNAAQVGGGRTSARGNIVLSDAPGAGERALGHAYVYGTAVPAAGTWLQGDEIRNRSPAAAGNIGWVATASGTYGTLSGVTADTTSGNPVIVVSDASNLAVGQFITIAGQITRTRIVAISGTSVTCGTNMSATASGVGVSWEPPVWKTFGAISA
jgi:hypothetical protein